MKFEICDLTVSLDFLVVSIFLIYLIYLIRLLYVGCGGGFQQPIRWGPFPMQSYIWLTFWVSRLKHIKLNLCKVWNIGGLAMMTHERQNAAYHHYTHSHCDAQKKSDTQSEENGSRISVCHSATKEKHSAVRTLKWRVGQARKHFSCLQQWEYVL